MTLQIVRDTSLATFFENAAHFLYTDEPENSLILGLCDYLHNIDTSKHPPPIFIRVLRDGILATVAIQTPPRNLVLTHVGNAELNYLVSYLCKSEIDIPGVVGPSVVADAFVKIWKKFSGRSARLVMSLGIHKIESVRTPLIHGKLQVANQNQVHIVAEWMAEFANESLPKNEQKNFREILENAQKIIDKGLAFLWMVEGSPVSMVNVARHTKSGASLNSVFTPMDKRNRGYASAAVAHLSQQLLNAGKRFCVLYADLKNSTSNHVYQSIGYEQIGVSKYYLFE